MPISIQLSGPGRTAVKENKFTFPAQSNQRGAEDSGRLDYLTAFDSNHIGELVNESDIIIDGEGSAFFSIKGHHPEKDGIPACLSAAEAVTARGPRITGQSSLSEGGFSSSRLPDIRVS